MRGQEERLKEEMKEQENLPGNRIFYMDCLRIFAVFSMMILHVSALNWYFCEVTSFEWRVFNFYDSLVRFCVPVFVMISGALFLDDKKKITVKTLFQHNILRIGTAFVFWSLFYDALTTVGRTIAYGEEINYKETAMRFVYGHYHMWFLFTIAGLYMITPLLRKITPDKKMEEYFIILSFLFCFCINCLKLFPCKSAIQIIMAKMNMEFVMGYSGYYMLGHYLHTYQINKKLTEWINVLAAVSVITTMTVTFFYSFRMGEQAEILYDYLLPNTFFAAASVFLFFKNKASQAAVRSRTEYAVHRISRLTFGMYLVHDVFNMIFPAIGLSTVAFNPMISVPLIAAGVFVCSMGAAWVISKIPVLNRYIM